MNRPVAAPPQSRVIRHIVAAIALLGLAIVLWRVSDAFIIAFGGIVLAALIHGIAGRISGNGGAS